MGASAVSLLRKKAGFLGSLAAAHEGRISPVSYTHLDVYKRQVYAIQQVEKNMKKDSKVKAMVEDIIKNIRDR